MPSKMGHEKKANLPVADVLILFVAAFFCCFPSFCSADAHRRRTGLLFHFFPQKFELGKFSALARSLGTEPEMSSAVFGTSNSSCCPRGRCYFPRKKVSHGHKLDF
jgi:hypothetical protein